MTATKNRLDSSKPFQYIDFTVSFKDIEWDIGKDPTGSGYNPETIAMLPKEEVYNVRAPDKETAVQWAMDDLSQDWGFLIQGCKTEAKERVYS